jgi:hypothetical protein
MVTHKETRHDGMPRDGWVPYYNRAGVRVCRLEYLDLFENDEYRVVDVDQHGDTTVSTIWLGIDHSFGTSLQPLIFETMISGGDEHGYIRRYATEDAARCGHIEVMEALLEVEGGVQ